MTEKTIKELIEEAQELGIDVHDHVAKELWGTVDTTTRQQAMQETYDAMYRGMCKSPAVPMGGATRKITEETINVPFAVSNGCMAMDIPPPKTNIQQTEDQMHRVPARAFRLGVVPFEVNVLDAAGNEGPVYTIHATSALDARSIAYLLDVCGGLKLWGDGQIDLAIAHTKVIG